MSKSTQNIIGKTVANVIAVPGKSGNDRIVMLRFTDGTYYEFVAEKSVKAFSASAQRRPTPALNLAQLSMFNLDGNLCATT